MTNPTSEANSTEMGIGRVEAFSDGVFAVAVTLLILNIQVPHVAPDAEASALVSALANQWPSYLSYLISFITIGSVWIGHHAIFRMFRRADETLQLINIVFLMLITAIPFLTALLSEYIQQPDKLRIVAIIFGTDWLLLGLVNVALWRYVRLTPDLLKPSADVQGRVQTPNHFGLISNGITFAGIVAAIFSPTLSVAIYAAIALYHCLPLLYIFIPRRKPTPKSP